MIAKNMCSNFGGFRCSPSLKKISYCYAESRKDHLCNLAAAKEGIPVFGLNIVKRGFWSVVKVNILTYIYWWNFLPPNTIAKASFFPLVHNFSH